MSDDARTTLETALPAYEVAGILGQGAFGVVYEARHTQLGRLVAIKQLPQTHAGDEGVRERFVAEAQMVASLDHPHIVPVYDFVESEGNRFLIMERCEGSVGDRFKSDGIVTDEACAAVLACLAALQIAHEKGLLHRDVKPENLMYDTKGVVKLGDFGIARDLGVDTRRTATGMIVGTPAYMSPEQCRGDDLTPASDVYSVAVMAYELLTGSLPFPETNSVNGLLAHHLVTQPTPLLTTRPELPGSIGEVIDRALAKDLEVRYSTAAEFATALARGCVTAFGSGWLRRRRFVLHWPEIIAETERPADNSPRTGTIMVRAGDASHLVVTPEDAAVEPTAQQPQPQPVAVVESPDAATFSGQERAPQTPAPPVPPTDQARGSGGPQWVLFGGIAAVVAAIVIALIVLTGSDSTTSAEPGDIDQNATPQASTDATDPDTTTNATGSDTATSDSANPDTTSGGDKTQGAAPTPLPAQTDAPAPTPTAFVVLMTERPADLDEYDATSPFAPTPCPRGPERVACIMGGVSVDDETGEILVPYFTEGFVPQLEPADYHLHFYLDTVVDGDETRAGTESPGGSWKIWDAPFPATSFGGENGRSLYTLPDWVAADARNLCVLVADPDQRAIRGTGNCAPLLRPGDDEYTLRQVNRLSGQFVGSCGIGVTAIVPQDWRWVDLVNTPIEEAARTIRPAAVSRTTDLLAQLIDAGGVLWADGPVVDDFVINVSLSILPGQFRLSSSPDEVRSTLNGLGVATSDAAVRVIDGREMLTQRTDNDNDSVTMTYFIADYDYVIAMSFTGRGNEGLSTLADRVAATVTGC